MQVQSTGRREWVWGHAGGRSYLQLVITCRPVARILTLLELDDQLCVRPDLATARRAAA